MYGIPLPPALCRQHQSVPPGSSFYSPVFSGPSAHSRMEGGEHSWRGDTYPLLLAPHCGFPNSPQTLCSFSLKSPVEPHLPFTQCLPRPFLMHLWPLQSPSLSLTVPLPIEAYEKNISDSQGLGKPQHPLSTIWSLANKELFLSFFDTLTEKPSLKLPLPIPHFKTNLSAHKTP